MLQNPRRGRQARNFKTKVPKILDLKLSTKQIFSETWRWVPPNSIPDSDRALPKYKFENTPQSRLLDILIQEDTYVGARN